MNSRLRYWKCRLNIPDQYDEDLEQTTHMMKLLGHLEPEAIAAHEIDKLYNDKVANQTWDFLKECGYERISMHHMWQLQQVG